MEWTWDSDKDRANKIKHGLGFGTARLVFDDPLAATRRDSYPDEERWQTIGMVGNVVLSVAHAWPESDPDTGEATGRIGSARKATSQERKIYEQGEF